MPNLYTFRSITYISYFQRSIKYTFLLIENENREGYNHLDKRRKETAMMTEHEIKELADELDLRLGKIKDMKELLSYLCREYAKAEYNYNQKVFANVPAEKREREKVEVELIRERITNITMYNNGWCYAHEGGGWYELDYEQGDSSLWY